MAARRALLCLAPVLGAASWASAGTIDTNALEAAWPKQRTRAHEVGRHEVRWRYLADEQRGLFAGVEFVTPLARRRVWGLTTDYADVGQMAPGVRQMRYVERGPDRQVIEVDIRVLWKTLTLTFEIEQEQERAVRFRWVNRSLGQFLGVCWLEDAPAILRPSASPPAAKPPSPAGLGVFQSSLRQSAAASGAGPAVGARQPESVTGTRVHLATWAKPARPVPMRLMVAAERMIMLHGAKHFLEACDRQLSVPE
jgi:hypothetical protein